MIQPSIRYFLSLCVPGAFSQCSQLFSSDHSYLFSSIAMHNYLIGCGNSEVKMTTSQCLKLLMIGQKQSTKIFKRKKQTNISLSFAKVKGFVIFSFFLCTFEASVSSHTQRLTFIIMLSQLPDMIIISIGHWLAEDGFSPVIVKICGALDILLLL